MKSSAKNIKLSSYDDLFGESKIDDKEKVVEIPLSDLYEFKNHPFKVLDDESMQEIVESVKQNGVLVPGIARQRVEGGYELIAGHRRKRACEIAGIKTMPIFVRDYTDDEAIISMVDSNIQREELLPSEKAFAFRMKMEALNRRGIRSDLNGSENVGQTSREMIASSLGITGRTVQRYIRLTELIEELLQLVDGKKIAFLIGVELSYLDKTTQKWIYDYLNEGIMISSEQIAELKKRQEEGSLTQATVSAVLMKRPVLKVKRNITINEKKLNSYFPGNYSREDMENVIYKLLEEWKKQQEG